LSQPIPLYTRLFIIEPDRPRIENVETGYDFVNVSWRSSAEEPGTNPASEFVVEYQLLSGIVRLFLCYEL